jgi:hypothetical protein
MQYFAGLVVFSGIGSFLISDTIDFGRELRKSNSSLRLYLDFLRLLVLGGMALIGYTVAAESFHQPNDWIVFLVIGVLEPFQHTYLGYELLTRRRAGVDRKPILSRRVFLNLPCSLLKLQSQPGDCPFFGNTASSSITRTLEFQI